MMPWKTRMFSYTWIYLLASTTSLLASQLPLEEDFGFDQDIPQAQTSSPLRRLWGVPDAKARVGQLFHFSVPVDAFEGPVGYYQMSTVGGKALPSWLLFNSQTGLLEGVPEEQNIGELYILLQAIGASPHETAKDLFAIEVLPRPHILSSNTKEKCKIGDEITTLTLAIDRHLDDIPAKDKITTLKNLAGFLGVSYERLSMISQGEEEPLSDSVIMAGPGNVKKKTSKYASLLQWQVGCGGKVFPAYSSQVQQIKLNARDGTLAEVIQLPVLWWNLASIPAGPTFRHRREVVGSGDSENDLEEEIENEAEADLEIEPETRIVPSMATPVFLEPVTSATPEVHRHRHQHGQSPPIEVSTSLLTSPILFASIMPTPIYIPERPTILTSIEPILTATSAFEEMTIVPTPTYFVEPSATPEPTTLDMDPILIESSTEHTTTESPTTPITPETSTKPEEVEVEPENTPPVINHKLPRQPLTAGKPFRYVIPDFIFSDAEDGNTRNLHLSFKTQEGTAVPASSWVQFNSTNQEVYALPLEENVSKWIYLLEAMDKEGETVQDKLELSVQNHKSRRTVTHQFTMDYNVIDIHRFTTPLDWHLLLLDRLASLYGDANPSHITVLGLTQSAPFSFTWTNDSLPRHHCPQDELNSLLKVIRASDDGTPTDMVKRAMAPYISVKNITWLGKGPCEVIEVPEVNVPSSAENYPPNSRNQVDVLNATVGELLIYTVPEDTFYDREDGGTRYLKLSLLNIDRTPIAPDHWLQFDSSNQEFYGIPKTTDVGRTAYQLECKDSGGKTLIDSLIVSVQPARKAYYNVEFGMSLNMDYEVLTSNPTKLRRFVEKIAQVFGDKDTSSIVLSGFSPVPTTSVTWHNRSLATDTCPHKEIAQLRELLVADDASDQPKPSENAKRTLGNEFPVIKATVTSTGICLEEHTFVHTVELPPISEDEVRPVSRSDEYLVTVVVPAVVISGMLLCAGIVACVLYRRRRTGKMSVGSEDERQSFRSKGIPVIFQDELEERPEPANKSPVIMKEEKPPLPPPEYHQRMALLSDTDHEDSPYQPPPPFASSRDSARPKPTPTYRMPPPYVPP